MRRYKVYTAVLSLFLTGILLVGCSSKEDAAAQEASKTITVGRGNITVNIISSGNLVMSSEANLTFSGSSTIKEILVDVGDWVEEGQDLASLETAELERNLVEAQTNVKSANRSLEQAKEPKTTSSGDQILSAPDPLDIEIKEYQLETAKMKVAEAEEQLAGAIIFAPFSGRIARVDVAGDEVSSNTVIVRLIDPNLVEVDIPVNEMDVYQLKPGAEASVQVNAMTTVVLPAKVASISPVATIQSGVVNYAVKVKIDPISSIKEQQQKQTSQRAPSTDTAQRSPSAEIAQGAIPERLQQAIDEGRMTQEQVEEMMKNRAQGGSGNLQARAGNTQAGVSAIPEDFELKEGLTVTVTVIVDSSTDVVVVPNNAITSRGGKTTVQIVKDGITEQRTITTGISDYQYTEVIDGLSEGEQVVVSQATSTNSSTAQQRPQSNPTRDIQRMLR